MVGINCSFAGSVLFKKIRIKAAVTLGKISADLIDRIAERTAADPKLVEDTLARLYPHGAIGSFMTEYFEMAFKGRDEAAEFEKATVTLFETSFGFEAKHVGPIGLTPDVLLLSDEDGWCGIVDIFRMDGFNVTLLEPAVPEIIAVCITCGPILFISPHNIKSRLLKAQ